MIDCDVIDLAAAKKAHFDRSFHELVRHLGLTPAQALRALNDFTSVCDQTGMSEKLRKDES